MLVIRFLATVVLAFATVQCKSISTRGPAGERGQVDAAGYSYDPRDTSCGGFPRLQVDTAPGTCLGMVLPRGQLIMPRTILQLRDSDDFLLVDMGGWRANNGGLYLMSKQNGIFKATLLKGGLNTPHGLAYGPDGWIYLGETHQISRFKFEQGRMSPWQLAIKDLPRFSGHMHPLTQFTFDTKSGDLFVNSGAPSDHCYAKESRDGQYVACPDSEEMGLGAIYRYRASDLKKLPGQVPRFRVMTAQGLRNSMAMVVSPAGYLIQGENSRDFPEMEEPYEEINVIDLSDEGYNYGWPYCYNVHAVSPEWLYAENSKVGLRKRFPQPMKCSLSAPNAESLYKPPHSLMPPHVAPLHMAYYNGEMFPELRGKLLVSWHGHQPTGQRLVAYNVDAKGLPLRSTPPPNFSYSVNQKNACPSRKPFAPRGGFEQVSLYTEVISGWEARKNVRPKGAPVGFTVARDGSIYIVEDRDGRDVVRLARTDVNPPTSGCAIPETEALDPRIELLAWRHAVKNHPPSMTGYQSVQTKLIEKYCAGCHGSFLEKDINEDHFSRLDFLVKNHWIEAGKPAASKIFGAITHSGEFPPMPPGGSPQFNDTAEEKEIVETVKNWIGGLPTNIESTYAKIVMSSARKIRDRATASSTDCGEIPAGDAVYVDPRPGLRPVADGWVWTKIYLLPGDSRLFRGRCQRDDGVYYVALKRQ